MDKKKIIVTVAASVIAVVVIVGTVATVFKLNKGEDSTPNDSTPPTQTEEISQPESSQDLEIETDTSDTDVSVEVETPAPTETPEQTEQVEQVELFSTVNETMYATTTVNVRDTYSTSGNKLGSLSKAQSVTRTGIGQGEAAGWSRIEFNGQVAYVSSDYLSATKPVVESNTSSGGSSSSGTVSKPSGGSSSSSGNTTPAGNSVDTDNSEVTSSSGTNSLEDLGNALSESRKDKDGIGSTTGPLSDEARENLFGDGLELG